MLTFQVNDMTCGHCAGKIAKALAAVDKSARVEFDIPRKQVRVASAAPAAELAEAIQDAGYTPEQFPAASVPSRKATGCGCGCGPRRTAPLDAGQSAAPAAGSCCS